jgi:lysozyme
MARPNRTHASALVVSAAALVSLALHESYRDTGYIPVPGDVPTVGFGHTGPGVQIGQKITVERGLVLLLADADKHARAVRRCAPVPMYQHEFDAYTSLAYNIGASAFCGSTVARRLNAGDYKGGCEGILAWDKFKGKPLRGLTARRQAEYQLCITDPAAAPSTDTGSIASASGAGLNEEN